MCVIVHQPAGTELDKERAERLWKVNPDGGGFAFVDDEFKLAGFKSMDFDAFWKGYSSSIKAFPNRDFLVHMRIATHGTTDLSNVHPFRVDEHTVMAHNGIIHGVVDHTHLSDTRVFIRDVLPRLPETWLDDIYITSMVENWIGWSKLMFLTTNPRLEESVYILNEHKGDKVDGMWFSNTQGVRPSVVTYMNKGGTYRGKGRGNTPTTYSPPQGWGWDDDVWIPEGRNVVTPKYLPVPSENKVVFDKDDRKEMQALLESARADGGLAKRIQWSDVSKAWDCWGCDEEVDEESGECGCWDKLCLDCQEIAGLCKCPQGYSSNLRAFGKEQIGKT